VTLYAQSGKLYDWEQTKRKLEHQLSHANEYDLTPDQINEMIREVARLTEIITRLKRNLDKGAKP